MSELNTTYSKEMIIKLFVEVKPQRKIVWKKVPTIFLQSNLPQNKFTSLQWKVFEY